MNEAPASRGRATVAKSKPQIPWKNPELIMYSSVRFVPNTANSQSLGGRVRQARVHDTPVAALVVNAGGNGRIGIHA